VVNGGPGVDAVQQEGTFVQSAPSLPAAPAMSNAVIVEPVSEPTFTTSEMFVSEAAVTALPERTRETSEPALDSGLFQPTFNGFCVQTDLHYGFLGILSRETPKSVSEGHFGTINVFGNFLTSIRRLMPAYSEIAANDTLFLLSNCMVQP
jgi:hypothetical protein